MGGAVIEVPKIHARSRLQNYNEAYFSWKKQQNELKYYKTHFQKMIGN